MIVRRVNEDELNQALDLVYKVFMGFEAPDYPAEGVESFVNDIIKNEGFKEGCIIGKFRMYGAFEEDTILGIMTMRKESHIMLAFVDAEQQKRGVGRKLFEHILKEVVLENPTITDITVNSSPYAVGFYKQLGFTEADALQEKHGIRFIPMSYHITGLR
jgi:ribosomal protein S18 acetylase RimI-like enzyme